MNGSIMKKISILIIFVLGIIMFTFIYVDEKRIEEDIKRAEIKQREEEERYMLSLENVPFIDEHSSDQISVLDIGKRGIEGDIIVTPEDFYNYATKRSGYVGKASLSLWLDNVDFEDKDIFVLSFNAKTNDGDADIRVSIGNERNDITISSIPRAYYIVASGMDNLSSISITLESEYKEITFSGVTLVNYRQKYQVSDLKIGVFDQSRYTYTVLNPEKAVISKASQLLINKEYYYALSTNKSTLTCYKKTGDTYVEQSHVFGMGLVRDMQFTKDKKTIVVTARQNGIYFIDISIPEKISIVSHYDGLEYASGLQIAGDYLFVSSRYFGIEIVDIRDVFNPSYICRISSDGCEYQDCFVSGSYLFVGVYSNKRVDIYDISDLSNIRKLSEIQLEGSGQGVCVEGNYLYAATALDTIEGNPKKLTQYTVGTGNGLEIYNISNPQKPELVSRTKLDGRLSINVLDVWDVTVVENYAYLSNMFGGAYIYDVSDPYNPRRIQKIDIIAEKDTEWYTDYETEKYIFPYNANNTTHGCVYHVVPDENSVYVVTPNMGVFNVPFIYAKQEVLSSDYNPVNQFLPKELPSIRNYNLVNYRNKDAIWAVDTDDKYVYVANGDSGITILNKKLDAVMEYQTLFSVRDIIVHGSTIFTAEGEGGIGIYQFSEDGIVFISRYEANPMVECYSSIEVSHDYKYVIAETSINSYSIVDVSDITKPAKAVESEKDTGLMYYRALCTKLVDGRYFGIAGASNQYWYISNGDSVQLVNTISNSLYSRSGGMTAVKDKCLTICNNGFYYYNPLVGEGFSNKVKIQGIIFDGKCIANDAGDTLVISREYDGLVQIVDITYLDAPKVIGEFKVDGNPDVAHFDGDTIYIPCRYYGLVEVSRINSSLDYRE